MFTQYAKIGLFSVFLVISNGVNAGLISQEIEFTYDDPVDSLSFVFDGLSGVNATNVSLIFKAYGDLGDTYTNIPGGIFKADNHLFNKNKNNQNEYIDVYLQDDSLGRWLDGNNNNDIIKGWDNGTVINNNWGSLTLEDDYFKSLIQGDLFTVTFDYSSQVGRKLDFSSWASVTLKYESINEPLSTAIFSLGLLGLTLSRKKFIKTV